MELSEKLVVVYIGGAGRSGSTLFDLILGNTTNAVSVGEVKHFFDYYYNNRIHCGCGAKMQECEFWSAVVEQASFSWEELGNIAQVGAINKTRYYLNNSASTKDKERLLALAFSRLYESVKEISGKNILVDSSKSPTHLKILQIAKIDLRVLHLIRHPLAVAYSWSKRTKVDPADGTKMSKRGSLNSIVRWVVENLEVLDASKNLSRSTVYFDEFIKQSENVLEKTLKALDVQLLIQDSKKILTGKRNISATHSVGGNPVRFSSSGKLQIRSNDEWKFYYPAWIYSFVSWLFFRLR